MQAETMDRVKTPAAAKEAVPSLEAVRLDKSFVSGIVQVHVLQGLSVSLYAGELSLISGPSGCGKVRCCR